MADSKKKVVKQEYSPSGKMVVQAENPDAQKRLAQRHIEQDSIISLRLSATHRIYGYITGAVFNILWYDGNHGDNATCVCRSRLKHT